MKNRQVLESIQRTVRQITPDVYQKVASAPVKKMREHDHITRQEPARSSMRSRPGWLPAAAALLAMVAFVYTGWFQLFRVDSVVDLDVNPSIELQVNRMKRVIALEALNEEGEEVVAGMAYRYVRLDNMIETILGAMYRQGYLQDEDSAVLISVLNRSARRASELEHTLVIEVGQLLAEQNPQIYSQALTDRSLREKAAEYHVSQGILNLMEKIIAENPQYTVEELRQLPIPELYQLAQGADAAQSDDERSKDRYFNDDRDDDLDDDRNEDQWDDDDDNDMDDDDRDDDDNDIIDDDNDDWNDDNDDDDMDDDDDDNDDDDD